MKYFLVLLFFTMNFCAQASEQSLDLGDNKKAPLMRTINPRGRIVGEHVLLLPMNVHSRADLMWAYSDRRNMTNKLGEVVHNPFDRQYFLSLRESTVWCMISRNGVFGHIVLSESLVNDVVCYEISTLGHTEVVGQTPLVGMILTALVGSDEYCDARWSMRVYKGNSRLKSILELVGFKPINPGFFVEIYQRNSGFSMPDYARNIWRKGTPVLPWAYSLN